MKQEIEHRGKVIDYYNSAQRFYDRFWHGTLSGIGEKSYGLHYGFWDANVSSRREAILRENRILADMANVRPGDLVIDAGCGIGGSGFWLAKERGARIVGIDLVHKQLTEADKLTKKKKLKDQIMFAQGDYQKLPTPSNSIDVFWSLESIEHATGIEALLGESYRVLRHGGRAIIAGAFRGREFLSEEERRQLGVGFSAGGGSFDYFKTADEVTNIMEETGFKDIESLDATVWVMPSSREMATMCRLFMTAAKFAVASHIVPKIMLDNQKWGIYQERLFRSGAISYNILVGQKL